MEWMNDILVVKECGWGYEKNICNEWFFVVVLKKNIIISYPKQHSYNQAEPAVEHNAGQKAAVEHNCWIKREQFNTTVRDI